MQRKLQGWPNNLHQCKCTHLQDPHILQRISTQFLWHHRTVHKVSPILIRHNHDVAIATGTSQGIIGSRCPLKWSCNNLNIRSTHNSINNNNVNVLTSMDNNKQVFSARTHRNTAGVMERALTTDMHVSNLNQDMFLGQPSKITVETVLISVPDN